MKVHIKDILNDDSIGKCLTINGWIKFIRKQSDITFIALNDGSSLTNLQIVVNKNIQLQNGCNIGASLKVKGKLVKSPAKGQLVELIADDIHLYGPIIDVKEYPLSKKHPLEYLRSFCHLRCKTTTISCIMRIRNICAMATHNFFSE